MRYLRLFFAIAFGLIGFALIFSGLYIGLAQTLEGIAVLWGDRLISPGQILSSIILGGVSAFLAFILVPP